MIERSMLSLWGSYKVALAVFCAACAASLGHSEPKQGQSLDQEIEQLKANLLNLDRDLVLLDDELRYPAQTRISVFLAMDVSRAFSVDEIALSVDHSVVATANFEQAQQQALAMGGVRRLHLGNINRGRHLVHARFTGRGLGGHLVQRETTISVLKDRSPTLLILQIVDVDSSSQPVLRMAEWAL